MTSAEFTQVWATLPTDQRAALLVGIGPQERELRERSATITQEQHLKLLQDAYEKRQSKYG